MESRQDGVPLVLVAFGRERCHGRHHGLGGEERREVELYRLELSQVLVEGEESSQFEYLHGELEDFNEVFDGLAPHGLALLGEEVEEEGESLLGAHLLADSEHHLRAEDERLAHDLAHALEHVRAQLAVLHVAAHLAEDRHHVLRRLVPNVPVVELSNVLHFDGSELDVYGLVKVDKWLLVLLLLRVDSARVWVSHGCAVAR